MLFVALSIRDNRFDGPLVHPLRTDVGPVLLKFIVAHYLLCGPFFTLQPLLCPFSEFVVTIERGSCLVHANKFTHYFHLPFFFPEEHVFNRILIRRTKCADAQDDGIQTDARLVTNIIVSMLALNRKKP
ncbi:hypothetical protein BH18ACI2_BH18ACI2_16460 [soil metagenome]